MLPSIAIQGRYQNVGKKEMGNSTKGFTQLKLSKKKVIRCLDAQMPFLLNREAKKMLSVRSFADHQEILRMI